jgi:hypothetical protein
MARPIIEGVSATGAELYASASMQAIAQHEPERIQSNRMARSEIHAELTTHVSHQTKGNLTGLISKREHVIAAKREVVECRGVAVPTGRVQFFRANDVGGGAHLHSSLS